MQGLLNTELFPEYFFNLTGFIFIVTVLLGFAFVYNSLWNVERWEKYGVKHVDMGIMELTNMAEVALGGQDATAGARKDHLVLFTRDVELIKTIGTTDFSNFYNHPEILATTSHFGQGLFFLRDEQWKRVRQIMSPTFSTSKLKGMSNVIQACATDMARVIEEHAREEKLVAVYNLASRFSASIIAKTAFGQEMDDKFFRRASKLFSDWPNKWQRNLVLILMRFPRFHRFLVQKLRIGFLDVCDVDSLVYLRSLLEHVIAERERAQRNGKGGDYKDLLQSLVAAKVAGDGRVGEGDRSSEVQGLSNGAGIRPEKTLTHDEVIAQSFIILFAGLETTASTLQYCLYLLASHPEIQEKVYTEMQEVVDSEHPTYEEISKLHYMEQVINETMRLLPPVSIVGRDAIETKTYGDITVPDGSTVYLAIKEIHKDPKHYPNPEVFDPERFNEEEKAKRDPFAFMPFGVGPRICIGSRLAMQELKTVLVHILRKVRFELNETTVPKKGEELKIIYFELPKPMYTIQIQVRLRSG